MLSLGNFSQLDVSQIMSSSVQNQFFITGFANRTYYVNVLKIFIFHQKEYLLFRPWRKGFQKNIKVTLLDVGFRYLLKLRI